MSTFYFDNNNSFCENNPMTSTILINSGLCEGHQESTALERSSLNETFHSTREDGNETQYFSILSDDSVITDLTLTQANENNTTLIEEEVAQNSPNLFVQPVLYEIEDSDEFLAVQITSDDDGNMQRIQFRMRQNENGELETIPNTTEILHIDDDDLKTLQEVLPPYETTPVSKEENVDSNLSREEKSENLETIEKKPAIKTIYIKADVEPTENVIINAPEENNVVQNRTDTNSDNIWIKSERLDESSSPSDFQMELELRDLKNSYVNVMKSMEKVQSSEPPQEIFPTNENEDATPATVKKQNDSSNVSDESKNDTTPDEETKIPEKLDDSSLRYQLLTLNENKNVSKTLKVVKTDKDKILVTNSINNKNGEIKSTKNQLVYIAKSKEKENVATTPNVNAIKTHAVNPRSILKTSFVQLEKERQQKTIDQQKSSNTNAIVDKRFTRNKEVMQAMLFQNYIAKTKITHAPIRQERLPRKQKINPVQRFDEEIIVKEVAVSSAGFIELPCGSNLIDIVLLTDSDNEHEKNTNSCNGEIIISDSDDDDRGELIQIDLSADSGDEDKIKKGRGRPRKHPEVDKSIKNATLSSRRKRGRPPKKKQMETTNESSTKKETTSSNKSEEVPCPKCSKSFPSSSSLKTHLHTHTLQEANTKKRLTALPSEKYQCCKCGDMFKNNALLQKHEKMHDERKLECPSCRKIFKEFSQLLTHKRSHVKEQMFKATVPINMSPKTKTKPPTNSFKCPSCLRTFPDSDRLSAHQTTSHKFHLCNGCNSIFYSKLAWQTHVLKNCVKPKSPKRRLSLERKQKIKPLKMMNISLHAGIPPTKKFLSVWKELYYL